MKRLPVPEGSLLAPSRENYKLAYRAFRIERRSYFQNPRFDPKRRVLSCCEPRLTEAIQYASTTCGWKRQQMLVESCQPNLYGKIRGLVWPYLTAVRRDVDFDYTGMVVIAQTQGRRVETERRSYKFLNRLGLRGFLNAYSGYLTAISVASTTPERGSRMGVERRARRSLLSWMQADKRREKSR
ncbi:hypothetical protein [Pseudolabrys taiwanensis]|nr:hypothetical protein [Pseudolabrys taiwanensis]